MFKVQVIKFYDYFIDLDDARATTSPLKKYQAKFNQSEVSKCKKDSRFSLYNASDSIFEYNSNKDDAINEKSRNKIVLIFNYKNIKTFYIALESVGTEESPSIYLDFKTIFSQYERTSNTK